MLAYDPKVIHLANDISIPCIPMNEFAFDPLNRGLKYLVSEKESIQEHLREISAKKSQIAEKNLLLLVELLNSK
jgi:hypothetical protein